MTVGASALAAVIIVNWNGRQHLTRCLAALFDVIPTGIEVSLVDNGSTDGSLDYVQRHWPQVHTLSLPNNVGFAAANNIGIRDSAAPYVITLNNDTEVEPGWLELLLNAAESDPAVGSCASRIVLDAQPDRLDSAGITLDNWGFAWQRGHLQPDVGLYRQACDVWGASAAAALYRRDMLDRIGLFDEEFESYYEDVDLAWRANRAGWRCRYVPDRRVRHVHSATGSRDPDRKLFLLTRNRWWTLIKNYPTPKLWPMLPLIVMADGVSLARGLLAYHNAVPVRARWDALRGLRRVWIKRRHK